MKRAAKYPAMIMAILLGVLSVEGGYVNHPSDPGGETIHGITEKTAREFNYSGPMAEMPEDYAIDIYAISYVSTPGFDKVLEISEPVGTKLIDAGVNVGTQRVTKWYQKSLNSFSRGCTDYLCIAVDGVIGPDTLDSHMKLIEVRGGSLSCKILLRSLDAQQGTHYLNLVTLSDFSVGWFTHRINNVDEALCD